MLDHDAGIEGAPVCLLAHKLRAGIITKKWAQRWVVFDGSSLSYYEILEDKTIPSSVLVKTAKKLGRSMVDSGKKLELKTDISFLEREINSRKERFGEEIYDFIDKSAEKNKNMDVEIRKSFHRVKKDVAKINVKVASKRAQIVEVEERTNPQAARKPRGSVDLIAASNVNVQMVAPSNNKSSDNAPTHHQVDVSFDEVVKPNEGSTVPSNKPPSSRRINWRFCFDTQDNLMDFLSVAHNILDEGGRFKAMDVDRFEHEFEVADHIYRWEMIVCPPVVYPIQIHGIVLSAGRNCLVIADFGLTGYGRKEGDDFNFADDRHQNVILHAWRKIRPRDENQRLNIVTLTSREEIQKWSKAHYDEARKRKIESVKKMTSLISKLNVLNFDKDSSSTSLKSNGDKPNSEVTEAAVPSSTTPIEHEELPKSDPSDIVLARANYLLEHEHVLPSYHVFFSNSECIAVWCKTGRWSTLQTAVFLATNSFGGAKGATLATLGMAAAHALLVPVVAVGGLIWVSAPMMVLNRSKEKWDEYTMKLTKLFWEWAPPAMYVSAIENWGGLLPLTETDGNTMPQLWFESAE